MRCELAMGWNDVMVWSLRSYANLNDLDEMGTTSTMVYGNVSWHMKDRPGKVYVGSLEMRMKKRIIKELIMSPTTDNYALIRSGPTSYAKLVTGEPSRKSVNFCTLITPIGNRADVAISLESIRAISERFANTTYGFFLGKRLAYPVVNNYVRNTWSKYGLFKSMLNSSNRLFFLQFSSKDGLYAMLENGPWFIRVHMTSLGVHMTAFSDDGLSIIATKLGTSLMFDSYTSDMCMQSWGMSSYARVMIELRADEELKDTIVVAMQKLVGEGFNIFTIRVESVSNKNGANTSGKNKQVEVSRQEGVASSSISTTSIAEKIDKFERQLIEGKLFLVDDDGKPLPKVVSMVNVDSDSEVEEVFDEHTTFMASTGLKCGSDSGYGTNSLWEQWKKTKKDNDYEPYDDDMYDSHDMSDNLQIICDEFDITVRDRKKK
ncbi:putative ribonuclease H-like domain-containing protein [Tanacetum coccineum]